MMEKPLRVFCCYAREDQSYLLTLKKHLRPIQHEGLIHVQADVDISPGEDWKQKISKYLDTAQIILMLISPDFMNSDYCYSIEMQRAMERHWSGEAHVIPIILRPVLWQKAPFGKLQVLPTEGKPITDQTWHTLDDVCFNVAKEIRQVIERYALAPQTTSPGVVDGSEESLPISSPVSSSPSPRSTETIHVIETNEILEPSRQEYISPTLVQKAPWRDRVKLRRVSLLLTTIGLLLGIVSAFWPIDVPYVNYFLFYGGFGLIIGGWIGDLVQTYQLKQWRWFVVIFLLSPLAAIAYGLFGSKNGGHGTIIPRFIRNSPKPAEYGCAFFLASFILIAINVSLIAGLNDRGRDVAYEPFLAQTSTADALTQTASYMIPAMNAYAQATSGKPYFSTPLQINTFGADESDSCTFLGGTYHVFEFKGNRVQRCHLMSSEANFAFQINMKIVKGNAGGIFFGYNLLTFSSTGVYSLSDGNSSSLLYKQASANIGVGYSHTITLIVEGSKAYIYLDHQYIDTAYGFTTDTSYNIDVAASADNDPTDVAFSNAKVWVLSQPT